MAVLTCTHNQCFDQNKNQFHTFSTEIVIFAAAKKCNLVYCIGYFEKQKDILDVSKGSQILANFETSSKHWNCNVICFSGHYFLHFLFDFAFLLYLKNGVNYINC